MLQKRHAVLSSASEGSISNSDSSISGNSLCSSSPPPTTTTKSKSQKGSDKGKKPEKKLTKKSNKSNSDQRDQCLHVARWIPHAIDMKKEVQERSKRTYNWILMSTPYLHTLIKGHILSEDIIGQICSEDASKLKPYIGHYVAFDAENEPLKPAIYSDNQKLHAKMGVNHPQLATMLCPIKHLAAFHKDPKKMAFSKVYLMRRVFCHIFKGPSSALVKDGEAITTHSGNAKLHNMLKVEAEHVAYTFVQCHFSISSRDKWQSTDEPFNETWADSLLQWWNMSVFGDKEGIPVFDLSDDDNEEEDDLSVSVGVQPPKASTPPSDPDESGKSVIGMTSTAATSPPPVDDPVPPVPAKAIPKP
ncbi:hypothetical protein EDD22DRAFT_959028 [Suillus occidentalis]|nr:hypothetical protein EDD22DRAFT_959028 [Suillus occidentalis]